MRGFPGIFSRKEVSWNGYGDPCIAYRRQGVTICLGEGRSGNTMGLPGCRGPDSSLSDGKWIYHRIISPGKSAGDLHAAGKNDLDYSYRLFRIIHGFPFSSGILIAVG